MIMMMMMIIIIITRISSKSRGTNALNRNKNMDARRSLRGNTRVVEEVMMNIISFRRIGVFD